MSQRQCSFNLLAKYVRLTARIIETPCAEMTTNHFLDVENYLFDTSYSDQISLYCFSVKLYFNMSKPVFDVSFIAEMFVGCISPFKDSLLINSWVFHCWILVWASVFLGRFILQELRYFWVKYVKRVIIYIQLLFPKFGCIGLFLKLG